MRSFTVTDVNRDRARPRSLATLAIGLVLAAALLGGGFELHPEHAGLASSEPPHGAGHDHGPVFSGAAHPDQPLHAEAAGTLLIVRCPACVLHFQSQGDSTGQGFHTALPSPSGNVRATAGLFSAAPALLAGGSRAPPIG